MRRVAALLLLTLPAGFSGCASMAQRRAAAEARYAQALAAGGAQDLVEALCTASAWGMHDRMKEALAKGADPSGRDKDGVHALWIAAMARDRVAVRILLDAGASAEDAFTAPGWGRVSAFEFAQNMGDSEMQALLLGARGGARRPAALEPIDADAGPLVRLIGAGDLAGVKRLLDGGMEPDARVEHRKTGLHLAAEADRPAIAELLLSKGANPDARNADGWTPLMVAAHSGSEGVAKALLKARADADARLDDGSNAAAIAAAEGHTRLARLLAETGAPPAAASRAPEHSDVDLPGYKSKPRPDDLAVVVGVERYSRLPEASYAERDAAAVARHLEALGLSKRNIVTLAGSAATRGALQGYLEEWLPKNAKPGATVFFYFSGHGAPDPKSGEAYLVPWDGDPSFLASTAIPVRSLYASLSRLASAKAVVALDACFSGAGGRSVLAKGARPLVARAEAVEPPPKLTVFAAAAGDEITSGFDEQGHGLFTYFFLKGLSEGKRTAHELQQYLRPKVQDEARHQNREQTPVLLGEGGSL